MKKLSVCLVIVSIVLNLSFMCALGHAETTPLPEKPDVLLIKGVELVKSLNLSEHEDSAIRVAVLNNVPALKVATDTLKAAQVELKKDIDSGKMDQSKLDKDVMAVARSRAKCVQIKNKLDKELTSALTKEHMGQLQAKVTKQFHDKKNGTDIALLGYALYILKQF